MTVIFDFLDLEDNSFIFQVNKSIFYLFLDNEEDSKKESDYITRIEDFILVLKTRRPKYIFYKDRPDSKNNFVIGTDTRGNFYVRIHFEYIESALHSSGNMRLPKINNDIVIAALQKFVNNIDEMITDKN